MDFAAGAIGRGRGIPYVEVAALEPIDSASNGLAAADFDRLALAAVDGDDSRRAVFEIQGERLGCALNFDAQLR